MAKPATIRMDGHWTRPATIVLILRALAPMRHNAMFDVDWTLLGGCIWFEFCMDIEDDAWELGELLILG